MVYLSDELFGVSHLPFQRYNESQIQKMKQFRAGQARLIKAAFADLTIVALGQGLFDLAMQNHSEILRGGSFSDIDMLVPYCAQLGNSSWAAAARAIQSAGKRVGCYSADNSQGDFG
eukprot:SAG11_NODE_478_length_9117_cov_6.916168_3_plen_117_part_00